MKPLFVWLHSDPYWRFVKGTKTVEVRQAKRQWHARNVWTGRSLILCRGFNTPDRRGGTVGRVALAKSFSDLPEWAARGADIDAERAIAFFDPDLPVLAFEVLDGGRLGAVERPIAGRVPTPGETAGWTNAPPTRRDA